jgi:hypothetical protein
MVLYGFVAVHLMGGIVVGHSGQNTSRIIANLLTEDMVEDED